MKHSLPKLPYAYDALEPHIDTKTMEIHHTKHHQAYLDKLNAALEKHPSVSERPVEELLSNLAAVPDEIRTAVRNHGGGHANHTFFWHIMSPNGGKPSNELLSAIEKSFGSFDAFKEQFTTAALNRFGSGWVWLVLDSDTLEVMSTANQDSPLCDRKVPLLGLDLWEHAYYLKHTSNRKAYIESWWHVVNWKHVSELFIAARIA